MKVVILAGGFGTRLSDHTDSIPKPMVNIGGKPMLWHIMQTYASFGHKDFYVALGFKGQDIKDYFLNYHALNSDFTVDLATGNLSLSQTARLDWRVTLIDTGLNTMTGGRIKRLQKFIGNESFMLTYGDGVSSIDLDSLKNFHKENGKAVTLSAVRPPARFGELSLTGNIVSSFEEKPQLQDGWINGGFFICEPRVFDYIDDDQEMFEREPMKKIVKNKELAAYKHEGFWYCVDTKRDLDNLQSLWENGAPWIK